MSAGEKQNLQLEIGHVLFTDIVGYSKLLINEQTESLQVLNEIVRETAAFRVAETAGGLIRLPTGDGMALVFLHSLEAPAQCALEISCALRGRQAKFALRMGVHSGPVNQIADVNGQLNLTGAGVNIACRVMDCGDGGHILLSKRVAEDLEHYREWQPHLHNLGIAKVKHGVEIGLYNLYTSEVGNPARPSKLRRGAGRWLALTQGRRFGAVAAGVLVAALLGFAAWKFAGSKRSSVASPNDKSVAVLPFESRSEDKANAYFAEGIQDEILTRLSKMGDLKVISRTSTQHYKSAPENLPEIAKQLGVAHVLEGSVQKEGESVRVNVQLIHAQTDSHLWAETYDRKLTDILAVESEVAKAIAEQLSVKLTGSEQNALSLKLTDNTEAYDAYLRGLTFEGHAGFSAESLDAKVKAYQRAVDLDPRFAQAWARLSAAHIWNYYQFDRTPARLAQAKLALDNAMRLAPEAGEVLLALGHYRYGMQDYEGALEAYTQARVRMPNSSEVLLRMGGVTRRLGRWEEALAWHTQAAGLDPRNTETWKHQAWTLRGLRRYAEALTAFDRALQAAPGDAELLAEKAVTYQMEGEFDAAEKQLAALPKSSSHSDTIPSARINQWMYLRQYGAAIAALKSELERGEGMPKTSVAEALSALAFAEIQNGEADAGRAHATKARELMDEMKRDGDDNPWYAIAYGAQTYSLLGDQAAALAEAQRAVDAYARDAFVRPQALTVLARAQASAGNADAAIATLTTVVEMPCVYAVTPALLRVEPAWDSIRNDARFQKLCEARTP